MLKLRLLNGPREGRQLRVSDTHPVSVGRDKGRLRLHDSRVSKRHAQITFADGVWVIRDLGSSNGTYVNHKRAEGDIELESGDLLQMGRVIVKVLRADEIGMDIGPAPGLDVSPELEDVEEVEPVLESPEAFVESEVFEEPEAFEAAAPALELAETFEEAESDDAMPQSLAQDIEQPLSSPAMEMLLEGETQTEEPIPEIPFEVEAGDDLISLDEEPGEPDAPKPGTTAIAAVPDEAAEEPEGQEPVEEAPIVDEPPEIVGLSLNQRPPQQPEERAQADEFTADSSFNFDEAGDADADDQGGFDIDAAFDALARGLDEDVDVSESEQERDRP